MRREIRSSPFAGTTAMMCFVLLTMLDVSICFTPNSKIIAPLSAFHRRISSFSPSSPSSSSSSSVVMVMALPEKDTSWNNAKAVSVDKFQQQDNTKRRVRKKYKRKRIPETERERRRLSMERQEKYDEIVSKAGGEAPSIFSFESLFPQPVWDDETIQRDLFEVRSRDSSISKDRDESTSEKERSLASQKARSKLMSSSIGASSMMRVWRDPKLSSFILPYDPPPDPDAQRPKENKMSFQGEISDEEAKDNIFKQTNPGAVIDYNTTSLSEMLAAAAVETNVSGKVDFELTRLVEDSMYGYQRGTRRYSTSMMGDDADFGSPLKINADRLNYHAKKELRNNRVEEAQELYETAIKIDPRDGRAYLGLSRCAQRRRDFKLAREFLKVGITNSMSIRDDGTPDSGANPFLLQALGCLEEKAGHLSQAESLYIEAARSRPSHAAAWVALAQLRTRKFRQPASAGRVCYKAAERELHNAGLPQSSHVYTAWASMEYKKAGDVRMARRLFKLALEIDPKCSPAWLQLGVMEADNQNWNEAELCFETALKNDKKNSIVLQAYAGMEAKRPDSSSRKVIGLYERALRANPRDAGVLQPYALYVLKLGEFDAARDLLRRGTEVNKRHAPIWQAWGVLETREGNPEEARNIFQQGIWACAQHGGGQSGGYNCARLWQAWGVLEAQQGDIAAARRCFSRALDADKRNIAAMTAWTLMEEEVGNLDDARVLYERALKQFTPGCDEKKRLWRSYELMEQRVGNDAGAQLIYQRAMRESITVAEDSVTGAEPEYRQPLEERNKDEDDNSTKNGEVEVVRWDQGSSSMKAEGWISDESSIEGKVPKATMEKQRQRRRQ